MYSIAPFMGAFYNHAMKKPKKKFSETKFGKFLNKAKNAIPNVAEIAIEAVTNPVSAIKMAGSKLKEKAEQDEEARQLLLEFEMEQQRMEHELTIEFAKMEQADRDSARRMQIEALSQDDAFSKRFLYFLAGFMLLMSSTFGIMLFYVDIPDSNRRLVEMFADIFLFSGAVMVLQFFFGGSYKAPRKSQSEQKEAI